MRDQHFLPGQRLADLLAVLQTQGFRCMAPVVKDGAAVLAAIDSVDSLPWGVQETQAPGHYRLESSGRQRAFDLLPGPQSLKPLNFAPREILWRVERGEDGTLSFHEQRPAVEPTAIIGLRACDLAALQLQDQHFLEGVVVDAHYRERRDALLLIAVNCVRSAPTCFCVSTGDGPAVQDHYDLLLDELDDGYLVRSGSERGAAVLQALSVEPADESRCSAAERQTAAAAGQQHSGLPTASTLGSLLEQLDHPRWGEVADRCLACGNCTAVCPTCFCHSHVEDAALAGDSSYHLREWDSCFTAGHSFVHGRSLRDDVRARYRQWLTHKLAGWQVQYRRIGCTGCGRCITWCPVGIDIREEVDAIVGGAS